MTKRSNISCLTVFGMLLAASPALVSQTTTGQLVGRVTDNNGSPIARALVILTAPQLMGQREVPTDANGEWRALLLPPGDYSIRISANGFVGTSVRNIRVGVGAAMRQDHVLRPVSTASETVEIIGTDTTVVDKTDTKTSINYSANQLLQITGGRAIGSAIDLSVGTTRGSSGEPSIRGGNTTSNSYRLDGADIREGFANQANTATFLSDQVEDMAVILSPTNARYGRVLGGAIEVVTKSGGNDFTGTIRVNASRASWRAKDQSYRDNQITLAGASVADNLTSRAQEFTLGGPIIKDRLWFTVAARLTPETSANYRYRNYNPEYIRTWRTGHEGIDALTAVEGVVDPITGRTTAQLLPSAANVLHQGGYGFPKWPFDEFFVEKGQNERFNGKLTLAINQNHRLSVGGQTQMSKYDPAGGSDYWREAMQDYSDFSGESWNVTYNAIFGTSTFAEMKVSRMRNWNKWSWGDTTTDERIPILVLNMDRISGAQAGGNTWGRFIGLNTGMEERNNASASFNLTMYRDFWDVNHNLDIGIDFYRLDGMGTYREGKENAWIEIGGIFEKTDGDWLFPVIIHPGANRPDDERFGQTAGLGRYGLAPYRIQYVSSFGDRRINNTAFYINDQMTINEHWNVMLGLRYDSSVAKDIFNRTVLESNDLSPRIALTYDPKGDSSHVFKFNYSRMQQEFQGGFMELFAEWEPRGRRVDYVWTGLPGQPLPGTPGDFVNGQEMYGLRFATLDQIMDMSNYGNPVQFTDNTKSNTKDPNVKPQTNTEYAIEYRRNYAPGSYIRMAYVHRTMSNIIGGFREYKPENWIQLEDPTNSGLRPMYAQTTHFSNRSELWRDYNGFEFETHTKLNSVFSITFNYGYSQLRGNTDAGDGEGTVWIDYNPPGNFNQTSYLNSLGIPMTWRAPSGALMSDRPHTLNAVFLAVMPVKRGGWVSASTRLNYVSGRNYSARAVYPMGPGLEAIRQEYLAIAQADPTKPNPPGSPATWTKWYSARGAFHQNDSYSINSVIAWEIPIWRKVKTMGDINITNILGMVYHPDYNAENDSVNSAGQTYLGLRGDRYGRYRNSTAYDAYANTGRRISLSMGLKF
ncbi:MAG: TonB-dependent receptor [Holophagaceae bacterium]|nr:TonB-dependent receptor [Holophagaceae bacterium]